jgi:hypothetical protein
MKKMLLFFFFSVGMMVMSQAQQAPTAKDSTLQHYVGKYKFPDGSVVAEVTVALVDGALEMSSSAGTSALEKQEGEDLYTIVQFQGTAKFVRDANKKVIGVSINAMGYQLEGTKSDAIAFNRKNYLHQRMSPLLVR